MRKFEHPRAHTLAHITGMKIVQAAREWKADCILVIIGHAGVQIEGLRADRYPKEKRVDFATFNVASVTLDDLVGMEEMMRQIYEAAQDTYPDELKAVPLVTARETIEVNKE